MVETAGVAQARPVHGHCHSLIYRVEIWVESSCRGRKTRAPATTPRAVRARKVPDHGDVAGGLCRGGVPGRRYCTMVGWRQQRRSFGDLAEYTLGTIFSNRSVEGPPAFFNRCEESKANAAARPHPTDLSVRAAHGNFYLEVGQIAGAAALRFRELRQIFGEYLPETSMTTTSLQPSCRARSVRPYWRR